MPPYGRRSDNELPAGLVSIAARVGSRQPLRSGCIREHWPRRAPFRRTGHTEPASSEGTPALRQRGLVWRSAVVGAYVGWALLCSFVLGGGMSLLALFGV